MAGSGNMAASQAGSHLSFGGATGHQPTPDDGTRLFQREAAGLAATAGGASTSTSADAGTSSGSGSGDALETDAALSKSVGVGAATGGVAIDPEATVVLPVSPVSVPAPLASTVDGVGARAVEVTQAGQSGGGRWLWGGAAFVLIALAAWWFAKSSTTPGVVVPTPSSVDLADPKQTLSDREALVPSAATSQAAPSTAAVQGSAPADATKQAAGTPPAGESAAGGPGAAGASGSNTAKKPVKPADGAAAVKPTEAARGSGKPEEVQPLPSQTVATPPKPAAVAAGSTPAASAEPCSGLGFFERESCLWKQCSTDAYRALPVCERFQSRKSVN
jgi:hypothetical protein